MAASWPCGRPSGREQAARRFSAGISPPWSWKGSDRIISDFEPVTAWAARRRGLGEHRHQLDQADLRYAIPRKGEDIASRLVMRGYLRRSIRLLACTGFAFGFPILPPVVDEIRPAPEDGWLLLVSALSRCPPSIICLALCLGTLRLLRPRFNRPSLAISASSRSPAALDRRWPAVAA